MMELRKKVIYHLFILTLSVSAQIYPRPSDQLPIVPLQEHGDPRYDPTAQDLSPNFLKGQLGGDFVPRYMSVSRPLESILQGQANGSLDYSSFQVSQDIRAIRFAKFPGKFAGKQRRKLRKNVRQFLAAYTFCPVRYQWRDLGLRFFPRWIREGACVNEVGRSCSIPPANSCQPSRSLNLRLLRWNCRSSLSSSSKPFMCKWLSVWYPIVTACTCTCPSSTSASSRQHRLGY